MNISPISLAVHRCKRENRPALLTYTVAGDNTKKKSLEILNSISKFVDIVVNGMSNRLYDVIAQAVDSISSNKKAMYKLKLKTEMTNRQDFKQIEESLGISMFDTAEDELPTSKDELDLHVSLNYKDDIFPREEILLLREKMISLGFRKYNFLNIFLRY